MHTSSGDVYQEERACLLFLVGHITTVVSFSFGRSIVGGWRLVQIHLRWKVLRVL